MNISLHCKEKDPIVSVLREMVKANIVRVPDARLQPLTLIEFSENSQTAKYRGKIEYILSKPETFSLDSDDFEETGMPTLRGVPSRSVNVDLGLHILAGFLKGFKVDISGLKGHFSQASQLSFCFSSVKRIWIDNFLLGKHLVSQSLNKENPVLATLFSSKKSKLLLIDSIITSNEFDVMLTEFKDRTTNFELSPLLKELASLNAGIKAKKIRDNTISFEGEAPLSFAFTCLELVLDESGRIVALPPVRKQLPTVFGKQLQEMDKTLLSETPQLISVSE